MVPIRDWLLFAGGTLPSVAVVLAASLSQGGPSLANRGASMSGLRGGMKTMCFGRYIVAIPSGAAVAMTLMESDATTIEPSYSPASSYGEFVSGLEVHEAALLARRDKAEGVGLREVSMLPEDRGRLFIYRESTEARASSIVEALVRRESAEWRLWFEALDEDIGIIKSDTEDIGGSIEFRGADVIPVGPGACIENGLLRRTPREVETFKLAGRIEELWWRFEIQSLVSGPFEKHDQLLTRMAMAYRLAGKATSAISVVRAREVVLDGRKGQEHVSLYPDNGTTTFSAHLELYGDATYKVPTLQLTMEAHRPTKQDPRDTRQFLSKEEALAIWDAMLKSIRPRPGAF